MSPHTACPDPEDDFAARYQHFNEAHKARGCFCGQEFSKRDLISHQFIKHNWLLCQYCDHAEEITEMLAKHQESDHCFFHCSLCNNRVLEEIKNEHFSKSHG
ncbi:hypothetical protein J3F83DRAFT_731890 [Trichoderma novae-zelandiae]